MHWLSWGSPTRGLRLPLHSHSLHWHGHASGAAATARELVAFEGDDAFLHVVQVDPVVGHIRSGDDVEASVVQGFQGVLVATVADELTRLEAEEVAAAVPLLACSPVVVAVAAIHRLQVDADFFQSGKQIRHLFADGFLSVRR